MGSLIFVAMSQIKFVSMMRASFSIMPSTERENWEKYFYCLWQLLPCLSLSSFYQQARILSIGSFLYVSESEPPNLTSIMVSVWISHNPQMRASSRVSNPYTPDILPPLIFWGLGEWGFFRIHSEMGSLVKRGRWSCHALCCGVKWRVLHCCN